MLPTLFELAAEYRADLEKLASLDLPEETVQDTLEGMGGALEAKAQNIASLVKHLDVVAAGIKEAEQAMGARRRALENRIESLKAYTLSAMQNNAIERIETPQFVLSVAKNPPAVEVYQPELVPQDYYRQPETPPPMLDRQLIARIIKNGDEVPGCRLTQGYRLSIK
jgi:hypothetical protein